MPREYLVVCPSCGSPMEEARFERHLKRVHGFVFKTIDAPVPKLEQGPQMPSRGQTRDSRGPRTTRRTTSLQARVQESNPRVPRKTKRTTPMQAIDGQCNACGRPFSSSKWACCRGCRKKILPSKRTSVFAVQGGSPGLGKRK